MFTRISYAPLRSGAVLRVDDGERVTSMLLGGGEGRGAARRRLGRVNYPFQEMVKCVKPVLCSTAKAPEHSQTEHFATWAHQPEKEGIVIKCR